MEPRDAQPRLAEIEFCPYMNNHTLVATAKDGNYHKQVTLCTQDAKISRRHLAHVLAETGS